MILRSSQKTLSTLRHVSFTIYTGHYFSLPSRIFPLVGNFRNFFTGFSWLSPHITPQVWRRGRDRLREEFGDEEERMKLEEEAEHVEDWVRGQIEAGRGSEIDRNEARESERKHRQMIKRKIIERKYFKPPQEQNLLTWAAKEQIRFLHAEDPEQWNIEKLAESFPVSEAGIRKILQSSFFLKSNSEILQRDRRVWKHWAALEGKKRLEIDGGGGRIGGALVPPAGLGNAAGNPALPAPKEFQNRGYNRDKKVVGRFESIVKGYCDSKEAEKKKIEGKSQNCMKEEKGENYGKSLGSKVAPKMIEEGKKRSKSLLESLNSNDRYNEKSGESFNIGFTNKNHRVYESGDRSVYKRHGVEKKRWENDSSILSDVEWREREIEQNYDNGENGSMIDVQFNKRKNSKKSDSLFGHKNQLSDGNNKEVYVNSKKSLKSGVNSSYKPDGYVNLEEPYSDSSDEDSNNNPRSRLSNRENQQSLGNLASDKGSRDLDFYDDEEFLSEREMIKKYELTKQSNDTTRVIGRKSESSDKDHVIGGRSRSADASGGKMGSVYREMRHDRDRKEFYLYDEKKGYQFPYGRKMDVPEEGMKFKNNRRGDHHNKDVENVTHKRGKDVYDDDGEFLYRTP